MQQMEIHQYQYDRSHIPDPSDNWHDTPYQSQESHKDSFPDENWCDTPYQRQEPNRHSFPDDDNEQHYNSPDDVYEEPYHENADSYHNSDIDQHHRYELQDYQQPYDNNRPRREKNNHKYISEGPNSMHQDLGLDGSFSQWIALRQQCHRKWCLKNGQHHQREQCPFNPNY